MASLRQLAKLAGVSRTTVMRALRPDGPVAEETRRRILALADEHGYSPPGYATALPRQTRPVVGCLVPRIVGFGDAILVETVWEACIQHQYDWLLRESISRPVRTQEALNCFLEYPVDGIILHSGHAFPLPNEVLALLRARQIPLVLVDVTPSPVPLDWVGLDENAVGEMAVSYLAGLGHRRIAFLGQSSLYACEVSRPAGVRRALARHGLPADLFIDTQYANYRETLTGLLRRPDRPTAIIGESDLVALHAIATAHQLGITVPRQLSVLGVGDYPYAEATLPPLTSITLRSLEVAQRAIDLLFERMAHLITPTIDTVKRIALKPHLVERASCAPPPPHG